jgi:hypothetical protein
MRSTTRLLFLIGAGVAVTLVGCRDNKARVENHLDPPSLIRLTSMQETERAIVACRLTPLPESLPSSEAKELGRAGSSVLVEVPKSKLETLSRLSGLERASVWGESSVIDKMDGKLKQELLSAWDEGRQTPIGLMARFADGTSDLEHALSEQGATPRTVAGPVVTLNADPETILRIVEMPGLMTLSMPQTLRPLDTSTP